MKLSLPVKDPLVVVLAAQVVVMVGAIAFMAGRAGRPAAPAPVAAAAEIAPDEEPVDLPKVNPHGEAHPPAPPMPPPAAKLTEEDPPVAQDFAAWPAGEAPKPAEAAEAPKQPVADPSEAPTIEALLKTLTEGNARSVEGVMRQRDVVALRRQFERGERADAVVVTCTDSRVVPELVFDQPAGTFSVLRLPAAQLDDAAVRAVDEAVKRLQVKSVLVMGHVGCSHVEKALAKAGPKRIARPSSLTAALGGVSLLEGPARDEAATAASISFSSWELRRRSKVLRGHDVTVLRVLYRPSTGEVRWLDGEEEPPAAAPVGRAPKGH